MVKTVSQNTTFLTLSYVVQKLFSFVYFILIARFIGVEDLGKYTFALSFTTIFAVFVDLGLTQALVRETAKYFDRAGKYLSGIIGIKLVVSLVVYLLVVTVVNLMGYPSITKQLVYLSGVVMVLDSFTLSFWGVFRGAQNLKYESLSVIFNQLIILTFGLPILVLDWPLWCLMLPFIAGSVFNFLYSWLMINHRLKVPVSISYDWSQIIFLFKIATPFALLTIFSRIYGYLDSVLLSFFQGDKAVGLYAAAMKIPFALQFIPAAFAAAIFPAFSYYYIHDQKQLKVSFDKAMLFLTVVAVPLSFGIATIGEVVISQLFGIDFLPAVPILQIMIFGLIFVFLNFPLGSLMNGCDRQVINTKLVGGVMVLNFILNIIFIPIYSYYAAAIIFLLCHITLFIAGLIVAHTIIPYSKRILLFTFGKTLFSALFMAFVLRTLMAGWNFLWQIFFGILIYFGLMLIIRGITVADIRFLWQSFIKRG